MKLIWLDLETSGLDPQREQILEVAAAVADLSSPFEIGDLRLDAVIDLEKGRVLDPFIINMHSKNGLLADATDPAKSQWLRDVEAELWRMVPYEESKEERAVLAGNSVHFDLGFLRVHMPKVAALLSHRVYDVSAVKLFCRSLGMPHAKGEPAHRAMADVLASIEEAKACRDWFYSIGGFVR